MLAYPQFRLISLLNKMLLPRKLTCALNAEGECRIVYEGKEMEFWQVSKMLLEDILFSW